MVSKITGVLAFVLLSVAVAHADQEAETAALTRLIAELNGLEPTIKRAEMGADPNARIQFQYKWLRADIEKIKQAIQDHLVAPHTKEREFEPLRGDYRR